MGIISRNIVHKMSVKEIFDVAVTIRFELDYANIYNEKLHTRTRCE